MASSTLSTISGFVDACGKVASGQLSRESSDQLRAVTERSMPREYHMPFPEGFANHAPSGGAGSAEHTRGLWHELTQHLTDLGYLSEAEFIAYRQHHKLILDQPEYLQPVLIAARRYVSEEDWGKDNQLLPTGRDVDLYWLHQHLGLVTERIGRYLTWDGSLELPANYLADEPANACLRRSLAYRLRTLATPGFPFPDQTEASASALRPFLLQLGTSGLGLPNLTATDKKGLPEFPLALTNINQLLKLRERLTRRTDAPLLYRIAPDGTRDDDDLVFSRATLDLPPKREVRYFNRSRAKKLLKEASRWEGQRSDDLSTRLLQIKLWQLNFYTGAIDGDWGEYSHRALAAFVREQADLAHRKRSLNDFNLQQRNVHTLLVPVNREAGIYMADFKRLTKELTDIMLLSEAEAAEQEEALFSKLGPKLSAPNAVLDRRVLEEAGIAKHYPPWSGNHRRRLAYTRRSFIGRILGGIKRVIRWLKKKVTDALEAVGGVVFGLVKLLLRRVRTGIQRFFSGFRYLATFLLGKPLMTVMPPNKDGEQLVFATKFQLDFDAVNVIPAGFGPEDPARHVGHMRRMMTEMDYFLQTTIDIIKLIGKLSNPQGWVWLAWEIGRAVLRILFGGPLAAEDEVVVA